MSVGQEKSENCAVCDKLAFKEKGRMRLWDGEKVTNEPSPNIIAYFHPECAKKYYFANNSVQAVSPITKEKILRNLDKISFDQVGHLANTELLKKPYDTAKK
ncbi:MAG: hypothetical protein NY202_01740 [Mollicutes bacterium UO1]